MQAMTDKAVRICEQVDSQFEYLEQTANEIYRAGWYSRYISKSALYQNELNIVKQLEISRDLMYKCTLLSLANDILVLNIQKNAVICKYGWFGSVQKYMDVYCNLDLSDAKEYVLDQRLTEAVRSLDGEQFALSYPDPNGNRDCRICILLRKSEVQRYLRSIQSDSDLQIIIEQGGVALCSTPNTRNNQSPFTSVRFDVARSGLRVCCGFPSYASLHQSSNQLLVLGYLLGSLSIGLVLAQLLTHFFAAPLANLLQLTPESRALSHKEAYRDLAAHIQSITAQNQKLTMDLHAFAVSLRGEWLLRCMIDGAEHASNSQMLTYLFPWMSECQPYFFLIVDELGKKPAICHALELLLSNNAQNCLRIDMPLDHVGFILWSLTQEDCCTRRETTKQHLMQTPDISFALSAIYQGAEALHACYLDTLEKAADWQNAIPPMDTFELLNGLKTGNYSQCQRVLENYRAQGNPNTLRQLY
ncbi:MAG: hypothetical protein RR821_11670, partial [Clostridia bacterium]